MKWIYLSPHLDDAIFSCGGLMVQQVHAGQVVEIWTVCAGDPPDLPLSSFAEALHRRWGVDFNAVALRRDEDKQACDYLGVKYRHFSVPDCIYRRSPGTGKPLYDSEEAIFGPLDPSESNLVTDLSTTLSSLIPNNVNVVCPMGVGGHVDHRLIRSVADHNWAQRRSSVHLFYYADLPYILKASVSISKHVPLGCQSIGFQISEKGFKAWVAAMALYQSQIDTFWRDIHDMETHLRDYIRGAGGFRLWRLDKINDI